MNSVKSFWRLCAVLAVAFFAQSASAMFVVADSRAFGKNSLVIDGASGLAWLNLNFTIDVSFNDVVGSLATDPAFADLRFGTGREVVALFKNAGFIINMGDPEEETTPERLAAGASFASAFVGVTTDAYELFEGYFEESRFIEIDPDRDLYAMETAGVVFSPSRTTVSIAWDDGTEYCFSTPACTDVGSWLVYQGAVGPVPEPSTHGLLLAGLVTVGLAARRRRA